MIMANPQGAASVIVYIDGSVLITHGGVEMGQGINTKMMQIAANLFQISMSRCHISETATDKIANASPTAGIANSIYWYSN